MEIPGRLIITKVVLENFKSYAGVIVIGPFHTSFTAVVGPNGSGKSNLLESLLFAFGKRARKMRLNKLSELIHKSQAFPSLKYAKVEVHFENILDDPSGSSTVPDSQFILSRTVQYNNISVYKINGTETTYEHVTNTLKSRGIDLEHNRFLILQGEVEQIAMMKPKASEDGKGGLLEYLEEIIGSDVYICEIQAMEKMLEDIAEKVTSRKIYAEQAIKALESLAEPMKQALVFLDHHQHLLELKNLKFQLFQVKTHNTLRSTKEEDCKIEKEMKVLEEEYMRKRQLHLETINEYETKLSELHYLKRQDTIIQAQMTDLMKADSEHNEYIKQYANKIKNCREEREMERKRIEDARNFIGDIKEKLPGINNHINEIKEERERAEEEFRKINSEVMAATSQYYIKKDAIEKELQPIKREMGKLKADLETNKQNITTYEQDKDKCNQELHRLSTDSHQIESEISNKTQDQNRYIEQLTEINKKIKSISSELHILMSESASIGKSINDHKRILSDIENDEKSTESASKLVREILNAKHSGILKGIIGRLGDLGKIDQIYDIAISSSSNMFDYIVVEKVVNGEDLLAFVRDHHLGKINIIILEKIQNFNYKNFKSPDPRALRLFDLLEFSDEKIGNAFYLALRNTLVTNSLEEARTIAFDSNKRWKVVTKSGEVINPTGEMMGFSRPYSGKVKLKEKVSHSDKISRSDLTISLNQLNQKIEKVNMEIRAAEGTLANEQSSKNRVENELKIIQSELQGRKENLSQLQNRLKSLQERLSEFSDLDIARFHELMKKNENAMGKLEKVMKIKTDEIARIEEIVDESGGEEFRELKKRRTYLVQTEERLEQDYNKELKKLCQFEKDSERYNQKIEKIDRDIEQTLAQLNERKEKKQNLNIISEEKVIQSKQISIEIISKSEELTILDSQKDSVKSEFSAIAISRESLKERKKEATIKLKHSEDELQRLHDKIENNRQEYLQQNFEFLTVVNSDCNHEDSRKNSDPLRFAIDTLFTSEKLSLLEASLPLIISQEKELSEILSGSSLNLSIIKDYEARKHDKILKETQFTEIKDIETQQKSRYIELKHLRLHDFTRGFVEISNQLRAMYRRITRGGDAELEFADSTDPFAEGIIFTVRPPHKSWKKMTNLSGGEKTLSSLALVFALHYYKPNALYVMDEVDAALDFQNVGVIATYIKARTKNAQFIVVSLRYQLFELADRLVGIYKIQDVSSSLTISPHFFLENNSENVIVKQTVNNINA